MGRQVGGVEAWAQVGGLSRPCRGSTGRPPHQFPQQRLRVVHAPCRSNTFQVFPEHSRRGRGPILGGVRCFPQAKGWQGRAGLPPPEWAVWAARVRPQREKKGVGGGNFLRWFWFLPRFLRLFFATLFRRSPDPFPDQGFGLLQIHLVLCRSSPAAFLFLRHQHPNLAKPAAQALHRGGIYAQSFSHFLHGFAPDRILFRCDLEDMAKESQGVFGKALVFRALGFPPPPVEALPSLPYKLRYRFFLALRLFDDC